MMKRYRYLLILLCFYIFQIAVCNPFFDFPIGDDWSYAKAVENLVVRGQLQYTGWTSMPLIVQVLWGSLFCLPFGFSHIALRMSTLVLAFAGGAGTYAAASQITEKKGVSFIIACLVLINPYYNQLAFTFATDVPYYAFFIWAVYFIIRYIKEEKEKFFLMGLFAALMATLIRDITIVLPAAFGIAMLFKYGIKVRTLVRPFIFTVVIIATIYLFRYYLQVTQGLPALYDHAKTRLILSLQSGFAGFCITMAKYLFFSLLLISLSLLPLSFLRMGEMLRVIKKKGLIILIIFPLVLTTGIFFFLPDVINTFSTSIQWFMLYYGAMDYKQHLLTPGLIVPNYSIVNNLAVFYASLLALGFFGVCFFLSFQNAYTSRLPGKKVIQVFFLSFVVIYLILVSPAGVYPRYLLPILPLACILISENLDLKRFKTVAGIIIILIYGYIGMAAAYDLMNIYRAKAKALSFLTEKMKVSPARIDGGFEFNGWHFYDPAYISLPDKNWWWVRDDEFLVTDSEADGYTTLFKVPYQRALPLHKGYFYIMKRNINK